MTRPLADPLASMQELVADVVGVLGDQGEETHAGIATLLDDLATDLREGTLDQGEANARAAPILGWFQARHRYRDAERLAVLVGTDVPALCLDLVATEGSWRATRAAAAQDLGGELVAMLCAATVLAVERPELADRWLSKPWKRDPRDLRDWLMAEGPEGEETWERAGRLAGVRWAHDPEPEDA